MFYMIGLRSKTASPASGTLDEVLSFAELSLDEGHERVGNVTPKLRMIATNHVVESEIGIREIGQTESSTFGNLETNL